MVFSNMSLLGVPAFIGNIGPVELGVVFVIVLIVFGPGKLPDVFKAFGSGVKQFKDAAAGVDTLPSVEANKQVSTTNSTISAASTENMDTPKTLSEV